MIIGVDLDDVLTETCAAFESFCLQAYGQAPPTQSPYAAAAWGTTEEALNQRFDAFHASNFHETILPRPASQAVISQLSELHVLHIITSRPREISEQTIAWVDRHFPRKFADVHLCTARSSGEKLLWPKVSVCQMVQAAVMLEDHPAHALACARAGIRAFLFDRPWKRSVTETLVTRVSCWRDPAIALLLR